MTDEATPTFYSAIENLIEGHKFINEQFSLTPNTSWFVLSNYSVLIISFYVSGSFWTQRTISWDDEIMIDSGDDARAVTQSRGHIHGHRALSRAPKRAFT